MKRALLIFFVLVAAVGTCFADNGDYLVLTTKVEGRAPVFQLLGGTGRVPATSNGTEIEITENPTTSNIKLEVAVKQIGHLSDGSIRYQNANAFDISIVAGAFVLDGVTNPTSKQATAVPKVDGEVSKGTVVNGTDLVVEPTVADNKVSLAVSYPTGAKLDSSEIASWTYEWTKNEELVVGDYSATITITYTVSQ